MSAPENGHQEKEFKVDENRELGPEFLERKGFLQATKVHVLETFPFLNMEEERDIQKQFDLLEKDEQSFESDDVLITEIKKVLATLNNTHTVLQEPKPENFYVIETPMTYKAGKFWIERDDQSIEVKTINGQPVMERLERELPVICGGTRDWKINTALRQLLWSKNSADALLGLENFGQEEIFHSKFIPGREFAEKNKNREWVKSNILPGNIGYLQINSWSGNINVDGKNIAEIVGEHMAKLEFVRGLIIDLRDNTGGNSELASRFAGRFIDEPQIYTHTYIRENGGVPTEENFSLEPQQPKINKPVVLLTGPKCLSSTEQFILMLKDTNHAVTIGETTGGCSGNPTEFPLTLGGKEYSLHVSTWRTKRNKGEMLEGSGIEPDIKTNITSEDVRAKRDVDVEAALKYFKNAQTIVI